MSEIVKVNKKFEMGKYLNSIDFVVRILNSVWWFSGNGGKRKENWTDVRNFF